MSLKDMFHKTKFDLEDPRPNNGAPIPNPEFTQPYTSKDGEKFLDSQPIRTDESPLNNDNHFSKSEYDLQNPGTPISVPNDGYTQKFTPNESYMDSMTGDISNGNGE
tara:strand:+ start:33 stop:353 length:321 start_codon:yes stop_codon:yes gene_type:complete